MAYSRGPHCQESCPLGLTRPPGPHSPTMQPPYDAALREAVRLRMSPPNRESVAEIARDTVITALLLPLA